MNNPIVLVLVVVLILLLVGFIPGAASFGVWPGGLAGAIILILIILLLLGKLG